MKIYELENTERVKAHDHDKPDLILARRVPQAHCLPEHRPNDKHKKQKGKAEY